MKKILLLLLTFTSLLSCKSQTPNERIEQDIKQIFNYIKNDNISKLKKHLITKEISKEYFRELQLISKEDYTSKMKDIYERQLGVKLSKEELDKKIENFGNYKQKIADFLKDNNQLNEYFNSMAIQDDYDIEYLNMIKRKGKKSINWNSSKLVYYYFYGEIIFSDGNPKKCYSIRTNIIELNDTFYYSLGGTHSLDCVSLNDKDMKDIEFIDFTK